MPNATRLEAKAQNKWTQHIGTQITLTCRVTGGGGAGHVLWGGNGGATFPLTAQTTFVSLGLVVTVPDCVGI